MADLVEDFLDMMTAEVGAAQNTIEAYRCDLLQFMAAYDKKKMADISDSDIAAYLQILSRKKFSPKTIARKLSALKDFFKFLFTEKLIKENPTANVIVPKQEKPLPKFLTEEEVRCLIDTAAAGEKPSDKRAAVMLELMYACGLRVSELVRLPENCINFDKRQILVRGKGSKERLLPVAKAACEAVLGYLDIRDGFIRGGRKSIWLFPSKNAKGGHMTRGAFFAELKNIAVKAGISPEKVFPHVLRHSFATHLLNRDADLRSVQKLLGHEDIGTTEIYTHILSSKLAATVKAKHPLTRMT